MMSYMDGGRLPFDINDFTASPKSNETHIQVINSSSNKETDFNIDDFFKTLTDTYTPAIPQPVPPVAPTGYYRSSYDQFNQYGNGNSESGGPYAQANPYNNTNTFNSPMIQPPPLPPPMKMSKSWSDNIPLG